MQVTPDATIPEVAQAGRLLSLRQVEQYLVVSRSTVFHLIRRKKDPLPTIKIGGQRRIPLDKLVWWVDNQPQS